MSIQEPQAVAERAPIETSIGQPSRAQRLVAAIERAGEWLNPLLVKECRQALKSKWFAMIFALVLIACWGWSIVGVARMGPDAGYQSYGPEMFYGYYLILAVPLMMIPFAAFRSLIAEREDNTYELVAITNLRPRQIVGGKLGSAVVQMLIYFSAVAPCLAFTYMLRGIDVVTICVVLYYTFMASVFFSLVALFLATLAKERHWQIVLSVVIIIGLLYAFLGAKELCWNILRASRIPVQEPSFWEGNAALLTAVCAVGAMLYLAAGAQLTFPSENRSTALRITMLVHQGLYVAWLGFIALRYGVQVGFRDSVGVSSISLISGAALYWFFMGSFMIGESNALSERVKRSLPRTDFARMFFSWFYPGPGTGYLFAISNLMAAGLLAAGAAFWWNSQGRTGGLTLEGLLSLIVLAISYVAIYLGLTHFVLRLIRRVALVTVSASFLIAALLLLCGWGVPWIIEVSNRRIPGYTLLHITDPFWTSSVALEPRGMVGVDRETILLCVVPVAIAVFLLNLVHIAPELRQARVARPLRVEEDEQERQPAVVPQPSNPWD